MDEKEARRQLSITWTHIRFAANIAKLEFLGGEAKLAVTGQNKDGGRVIVSWDIEPFLEDLKLVLGADLEAVLNEGKEDDGNQ